jgi:hypothetical protein
MILYGTLATKVRFISFRRTDAPPLTSVKMLNEIESEI